MTITLTEMPSAMDSRDTCLKVKVEMDNGWWSTGIVERLSQGSQIEGIHRALELAENCIAGMAGVKA